MDDHAVFAIHGAFSSPRIFNLLKLKLGKGYRWDFLDYSSRTGGIDELVGLAIERTSPCHVIGHSMGGLVALAIANEPWVRSVTTISCPIGGLDVGIFQACVSRSEFMKELSSHGDFIRKLSRTTIDKPVQHIISTSGFHPWIYEPNDGVVPIRSQMAMAWGTVHEIPANHAEVMMADETVAALKTFLGSISSGNQ
jgi:pimeloyl-ACP methyl ester carboxylesterase